MIKNALAIVCSILLYSASFAQSGCIDYLEAGDFPRTVSNVEYQYNAAAWNFTNINQQKVTGLNIYNNMFRGLLEYVPAGYNSSDKDTHYPVIIFFHGGGSRGDGSERQLCRLFKDRGDDMATHKSVPGRIARKELPLVQQYNGKTYKFIVISPQFFKYDRPADETASAEYPTAQHVEAVINYVVGHYNVDTNRIYLTGYSNGANMIVEYAASSVARAKRIAAIMPVSFCSSLTSQRNINAGLKPSYIATAKLPTWFVQCNIDVPCTLAPAEDWVTAIKSSAGNVAPRYTILRDNQSDPLYQCSDTLLHDAWSRAYDPIFKKSFVNGNGADDNIHLNMCEWFIRQSRESAPNPPPPDPPDDKPKLTAITDGGTIRLTWDDKNMDPDIHYVVERAGTDRRFIKIDTDPVGQLMPGRRRYITIDNASLTDVSFYRLVEIDKEGNRKVIDVANVINDQKTRSMVFVTPNPFTSKLTTYLSLDKAQNVEISLSDLNGRLIRKVKGFYAKGDTELRIPSEDLPKGVYLLKASGSSFTNAQKVIKR